MTILTVVEDEDGIVTGSDIIMAIDEPAIRIYESTPGVYSTDGMMCLKPPGVKTRLISLKTLKKILEEI